MAEVVSNFTFDEARGGKNKRQLLSHNFGLGGLETYIHRGKGRKQVISPKKISFLTEQHSFFQELAPLCGSHCNSGDRP